MSERAADRARAPLSTPRSKARRAALELLFEAEQRTLNASDLLQSRIDQPVRQAPLREYTCQIVRGVVAHWTELNETLATYSHGWALSRMPAVDRAILRVGAWEIIHNDDVPDAVAVSEAVDLATSLSTEASPAFVNGLLSRIAEIQAVQQG